VIRTRKNPYCHIAVPSVAERGGDTRGALRSGYPLVLGTIDEEDRDTDLGPPCQGPVQREGFRERPIRITGRRRGKEPRATAQQDGE